ncbi:hypothetical protein TW65_03007 [Stemphylium lycopersici]|nr:hypothetical protein TW65_03007 [Stemphylium lycopersici]
MPKAVPAQPKKIILCCDGTSQSSVSGELSLPSNITRIARTIAKAGHDGDHVWQQLVYYDAGVGTGALSWVESVRQGATGDGLITNVLEAYNFVVNNYSPGDKIYCFGFSRGAFTARAIAGMITDFGVIKPDSMKHFPSLFAAYKTNTKKHNFRKTKAYYEWYAGKVPLVHESQKDTVCTMPYYNKGAGTIEYENSRSVELVGVFDTVGSLGLGDTVVHSHASSRRQYEWLNVKWNPYIKHAFHALALDDHRKPFLPTLYYIPNDDIIKAENAMLKPEEKDWPELADHRRQVDEEFSHAMKAQPDLRQVWFTGVHINIGGGTDEEGKEEDSKDEGKTDLEGLANVTFAWMVDQCRPYLAFDDFTNDTIANYLQRTKAHDDLRKALKKENPTPSMIEQAVNTIGAPGRWLGSFFASYDTPPKMVRPSKVIIEKEPVYQTNNWTLFRFQDSYSPKWFAFGSQVRTPGACHDMSTEDCTAKKEPRELGRTNEWMHPSVKWRVLKSAVKDKVSGVKVDHSYEYNSEPLQAFRYEQKNGMWGYQHTDQDKKNLWIPEWPIIATIKEKDTTIPMLMEANKDNAEMALIEKCADYEQVLDFLGIHATPYQKVNPGSEYPGSSAMWMRTE